MINERGEKKIQDLVSRLPATKPHPEAEARQRAQDEESRRIRIGSLRERWNAPQRQLCAKNLDRSGEWGIKERDLKAKLGSGFCVGLIGIRGPGKTQLGVELMREATQREKVALYTHVMEFFMEVKATYGQEGRLREADAIKRFIAPDFLVIDEVGERGETTWEDRMLGYLIDKRYQGSKDTLLISNHTLEEFLASVGPSIASRMKETGGIIKCEWKSYR